MQSTKNFHKIYCPYCNHRYYWSRLGKRQFESVGTVQAVCRNCNQVYWIEKTNDNTSFFIRTNRTQENLV